MRILFYQWGNFNEKVIENTLRELGHFVHAVSIEPKEESFTQPNQLSIMQEVSTIHANIIFTVDYFHNFATIAQKAGVIYVSWLFHIPQWNLYSYQAQLPCNRIFSFDSEHVKEMKQQNINNVQYMSLAADKMLLDNAMRNVHESELKTYTSDVSFVGTLYESNNNSFKTISDQAKETETYKRIVSLVKEKKFTYGGNVLYRNVDDEITDFLIKEADLRKDHYFFASQEAIAVESVLARKITIEERKTAVRALAKQFDFKLYSASNTQQYPEIRNMGKLPFARKAPLVYHCSKINVYITPRSIRKGIPIRVLEIMACGGFVLTNYQEDLAKEFENGKEVVMYRSLEELLELTDYYLTHEEERIAIAKRGTEKVLREYNFAEKLRKIFDGRNF